MKKKTIIILSIIFLFVVLITLVVRDDRSRQPTYPILDHDFHEDYYGADTEAKAFFAQADSASGVTEKAMTYCAVSKNEACYDLELVFDSPEKAEAFWTGLLAQKTPENEVIELQSYRFVKIGNGWLQAMNCAWQPFAALDPDCGTVHLLFYGAEYAGSYTQDFLLEQLFTDRFCGLLHNCSKG